ncbi:MAG: NUDIX hydrolase [Cyclobacteriaceae bacterium]|nr:NUDIX hydrolase [Cyclobacteriaceae bacterium]
MGRDKVIEDIKSYSGADAKEEDFKKRFLILLEHPHAFERTHLPGHITGSAFIISEDHTQTLLVHHAKLNRWLQPGGHADGDTDVARVAMREANEETGLIHLTLSSPRIFDIDIHPIPQRKDFGAHDHYDIRYLVTGSMDEKIIVSEESHDVKWVKLSELENYTNESSVLRMRDKVSNS